MKWSHFRENVRYTDQFKALNLHMINRGGYSDLVWTASSLKPLSLRVILAEKGTPKFCNFEDFGHAKTPKILPQSEKWTHV